MEFLRRISGEIKRWFGARSGNKEIEGLFGCFREGGPDLNRGKVLVVHNSKLGGGSRIFLKRWIRDHLGQCEIFLLDFRQGRTFSLYCGKRFLKTLRLNTSGAFREFLEEYGIGFVFVNQLAETGGFWLLDAIAEGTVPYEYFIHDYFCVCPGHYFLLDDSGNYFGECLEAHFSTCRHRAEVKRLERFLSKASRVRAPSESARKMFLSRYPDLEIETRPHEAFYEFPNIYGKTSALEPVLTIGVLGAIGPHKGARVVEALVEKFRDAKIPVRLKVIGYTDKQNFSHESADGFLGITGKYSHEDLPGMISKSGISFFLFPSVWPETFSYACDEILRLGYPILMFDLGAQRERIRNGEFGWTVPLSSGVPGMFRKITELEERREAILEKAEKIRESFREEIDVIVPVFNGLEHLEKCVKSVLANTDTKCNLLIIDDASTEDAVRRYLRSLESSNPFVRIVKLRNEENLGFVKTANRGMKSGKNHCVLLNSDAVVPPGWLSRLAEPLKKDMRIASVTPYSNRASICSFPEIDRHHGLPEGVSLDELDGFFQKLGKARWEEIPTGIGFCMLMNRNVIREIGYFNEEIFGRGYGEENDWCLRAVGQGYRNVHLQNLFVFHAEAGSFGEEAAALRQAHIAELLKIYPDYGEKIQKHLRKDPCRSNREFVKGLIRRYGTGTERDTGKLCLEGEIREMESGPV